MSHDGCAEHVGRLALGGLGHELGAVHHPALVKGGDGGVHEGLFGGVEVLEIVNRVEGDVVVRHEDLPMNTQYFTNTIDLVETHHASIIQHHGRVVHERATLETVQFAVLAEEVWKLAREALFAQVLDMNCASQKQRRS